MALVKIYTSCTDPLYLWTDSQLCACCTPPKPTLPIVEIAFVTALKLRFTPSRAALTMFKLRLLFLTAFSAAFSDANAASSIRLLFSARTLAPFRLV